MTASLEFARHFWQISVGIVVVVVAGGVFAHAHGHPPWFRIGAYALVLLMISFFILATGDAWNRSEALASGLGFGSGTILALVLLEVAVGGMLVVKVPRARLLGLGVAAAGLWNALSCAFVSLLAISRDSF